jgi:hypothetical protein
MKLPEIALELRRLSVVHEIPRLAELAAYIRRRKPVRKPAKIMLVETIDQVSNEEKRK